MKKLMSILIGLILIAPFITAQGIRNESNQSQVTENKEVLTDGCVVTYVEGEAFFQSFTKVGVDMEILPGDELITRRGRIEAYLGNGNFLRMDRNTRVAFVKLGENATLLGIWNGSIYLAIKTAIEVQAPDQNFVLDPGSYRIDIEKDRTKVYQNPRVVDSFDSWSYERDNEINHPATTETGYLHDSYGLYSYWSWRWNFLYHSWYWNSYYWYFSWSPIWHSYHSYFYWHYQYYNSYRQRSYYAQHRAPLKTTVSKNQLQAPIRNSNRNISNVQNKQVVNKQQIKSSTFPSRINRSNVTAPTRTPIRAPQSQFRRSTPSHLTQRLSAPRSFSRPPMSRPIQKRIVRKK